MALTIEDLKPKPFKITVKDVELECEPPRLADALSMAKVGNIFQNASKSSRAEILQAEAEMDDVIGHLVPELKGAKLDMAATIEFIEQVMNHIQPSDNKELRDKGVSLDTDPKA